ncbi:hypothetical protein HHI36_021327 [Cryptolaemus montrouzieri]|uniref:Uncharacterized protein n=1 Tax=Cryptolaemus montrouzieri TaxID=559131 RepID=A0ABD2MWT6_9CUCU
MSFSIVQSYSNCLLPFLWIGTTMALFRLFGSCPPAKVFVIAAAEGPDKVVIYLLRKTHATPSSPGQELSFMASLKTTVVGEGPARYSVSKVGTQFKSSRINTFWNCGAKRCTSSVSSVIAVLVS